MKNWQNIHSIGAGSSARRPERTLLALAFRIGLFTAMTLVVAREADAYLPVKSGDKIVFLGDSITRQGAGPEGWCGLVTSSLKTLGVEVEAVNAGRGGNSSRDLAARFEADVIAKNPAWMTLMCGTNDNPNHGLSLDESRNNIRTIIEKTQAAGIKVILLTMPVRGGVLDENAYNEFIRHYAKEKGIRLADVFEEMKKTLAMYKAEHPELPPNSPPLLTIADGTHMNARGNQVIAQCVLAAFGLDAAQIAKAKASWPTNSAPPGATSDAEH